MGTSLVKITSIKLSLIYHLISFLLIRGLDNKITVFPLNVEEEVQAKKKHVGTHTSHMSCCLFPGTDQQVNITKINTMWFDMNKCVLFDDLTFIDINWKW